jgi:hypothetical protein
MVADLSGSYFVLAITALRRRKGEKVTQKVRVQRSAFNVQRTRARRRAQDLSEWQQGSNPRLLVDQEAWARWCTNWAIRIREEFQSVGAHHVQELVAVLISAPHHHDVTFPSFTATCPLTVNTMSFHLFRGEL